MKNKNILVTAIGTVNGTAIINELRKSDLQFHIIGADINPAYCIVNSQEVDEFYRFPSVLADSKFYYEYVLNFCKEHNVGAIFCVIDEEVVLYSEHREEFQKNGITLCIADSNTINICHNKDIFSDWIKNNMPSIWIRRFNSSDEIKDTDYPVFIKPIEGRASIGCKKIANVSELESSIDDWSNYIVQEFLDTEILAVDFIRNRETGFFAIVQRKELLRNSNGCGIAVEIVDYNEITEICKEIAIKLDLHGVINAEFFMTNTQGPKIIEVNPRLPAGTSYSCMAGLNSVINALRIAEGKDCIVNKIKIGAHFARKYVTYEMK